MQKLILIIGAVIIVALVVVLVVVEKPNPQNSINNQSDNDSIISDLANEERLPVQPGSYVIDIDRSIVNWAGRKPLIDGYINSGTLNILSGEITGDGTMVTGSFVIDMTSLKVGLTAQKPNQETALEGHLKGSRWFDVDTYPIATFVIRDLVPDIGGEAPDEYVIVGELTLKGVTKEIEFPATIYQVATGEVVAVVETEINRTEWGINFGSGSFFANLADNVIDDMIALSFTLVAIADQTNDMQSSDVGQTQIPNELPPASGAATIPSALVDTAWVWQVTNGPVTPTFNGSPAGRFVVTFSQEGAMHSTTDCNSLGGSYTISDSSLQFGEMRSTLMYCEGSQEQTYASQLGQVESYKIEGSTLYLYLANDRGVMVFSAS